MLVRKTDPNNVKKLPPTSHYPFDDTNPYLLIVGLAGSNGYTLLRSKDSLFPREVAPSHGDDTPDAGSIEIRRGVLTLNFYHLRGFDRLRFRWDGQALRLIGYECAGPSGGDVTSLSVNYLTKSAKITRSPIGDGREETSTVKIKDAVRPTLEQFDWDSEFSGTDVRGAALSC